MQQILSMMYVLMSRKTAKAYRAVFQKILEIAPFFKRLWVLSDFEDALMNTVAEFYGEDKTKGCKFHFHYVIIL